MSTKKEFRDRVKPAGKSGRRSYAGQSVANTSKRSGGGNYNWGNAMDGDYDEDYEEEYYEQEETNDASMLQKMRAATIVQEKALAAKYRREGENVEASSQGATPWGQSNRLEAMKERLLALEREKIARMDPERLELMNLLADMGHNLDEDTVTALIRWKRS